MSDARFSGRRDDPQAQGPPGGDQAGTQFRPASAGSPAGYGSGRTGGGEEYDRRIAGPAQGGSWIRPRLRRPADGYGGGVQQHGQQQHDQQQCGARSSGVSTSTEELN